MWHLTEKGGNPVAPPTGCSMLQCILGDTYLDLLHTFLPPLLLRLLLDQIKDSQSAAGIEIFGILVLFFQTFHLLLEDTLLKKKYICMH